MLRLLVPADYRTQPWKNGGGTTTEICVHPEGAGWETFGWRVGIADIARSGPFSSFAGIDRSIMLLDCPDGSSMALDIDGELTGLPLHAFVDFAGEATTHGHLQGAPARDFNVMSRREAWRHRRGVARLAGGGSLRLDRDAWRFVHLCSGAAMVRHAGGEQALPAGSSVLADAADPIELMAGHDGCMLAWASFVPVAAAAPGSS
jgi:environmental stress-induced protein Ves